MSTSKLEILLSKLGRPGRLQVLSGIILVYSFLHAVTMNFIISFVTMTPSHRCKLPSQDSSSLFANDSDAFVASCHRYVDADNQTAGWTSCQDGYVYDHRGGPVRQSISTEFGLVCDLKYLARIFQLCYFVGVITGGVVGGLLADAFGRRRMWMVGELTYLTMGVCIFFCRDLLVVNLLVFLLGVSMQTKLLTSHALIMEMFPSKYRTLIGILILSVPGMSFAYAAGLAYYLTDWRLQILCHSLLTLLSAFGYCFLPESIRWLLTHQHKVDALEACRSFARFNSIVLPFSIEHDIGEVADEIKSYVSTAKRQTIVDFLKHSKLRRYTFVLCFAQFTAQLSIYGFSFLVSELGGNMYLNCLIISSLDTLLRFSSYFAVKSWGRKNVILLTLFTLGTANLVFVAIRVFSDGSSVWKAVVLVVGMCGRIVNGIYFCAFFILLSEVFPTTVRSSAQGLVMATGRAGLMSTPLMLIMSDYIWRQLPFLIFGVFGLIAAVLSFSLPETKNQPMLNTIEEAVDLTKKKKPLVEVKEVELAALQTI